MKTKKCSRILSTTFIWFKSIANKLFPICIERLRVICLSLDWVCCTRLTSWKNSSNNKLTILVWMLVFFKQLCEFEPNIAHNISNLFLFSPNEILFIQITYNITHNRFTFTLHVFLTIFGIITQLITKTFTSERILLIADCCCCFFTK